MTSGEPENAAAVGGTITGITIEVPRKTPVEMHVVKNSPPVMLRLRIKRTNVTSAKNIARDVETMPSIILIWSLSCPRPVQNKKIAIIVNMTNSQK